MADLRRPTNLYRENEKSIIYIYKKRKQRERTIKKKKIQKEQLLDIFNFNCFFEDTSFEVKINIHAPHKQTY